jgi:hypothetical protein
MKSEIIKSKKLKNGTVELFEFQDYSGQIINYSVIRAYFDKNALSGAAETKEVKFSNKDEALNFFNNET